MVLRQDQLIKPVVVAPGRARSLGRQIRATPSVPMVTKPGPELAGRAVRSRMDSSPAESGEG